MSIIDKMSAAMLDYEQKSGVKPEYCYLSYDEGFDLLKTLMPTMVLTHMQRVELNIVLKEQNIAGLKQAFTNATFRGAEIKLNEEA